MSVSTYLAAGFSLHWPEEAREPARRCGLCGTEISTGVAIKSLIKVTTADIADTFRYDRHHVCGDCAACFAEPRLLTGNLFATQDYACKPLVALSSTTEDRPAWRDLLRRIPTGTSCVAIITSNTKRRLWPLAAASTFGPTWRPLFVDGDIERLLNIDAERFLRCLDLVEEIYASGFSKRVIGSSLLSGLSAKSFAADARRILQLEAALQPWRGTDEFVLSLYIAQKEEKEENDVQNHA